MRIMKHIVAAGAVVLATSAVEARAAERWNVEIRDAYGADSAKSVREGRIVGTADLVTGDNPKQILLPGATAAVPSSFVMDVRKVKGGYRLRVTQTTMTDEGPETETAELGFDRPEDVQFVAGFGSGDFKGRPQYMRGFVFRRL